MWEKTKHRVGSFSAWTYQQINGIWRFQHALHWITFMHNINWRHIRRRELHCLAINQLWSNGVLRVQTVMIYSISAFSTSASKAVTVFSFLHFDSPWHKQNTVHGSLAALQRHWAVKHGFSEEQRQWIISSNFWGASGVFADSSKGTSDFEMSSDVHPYNVGSNVGGSASQADIHIVIWMWALRTFNSKASVVGGRFFRSGAAVAFRLTVLADQTSTRTSDILSIFVLP